MKWVTTFEIKYACVYNYEAQSLTLLEYFNQAVKQAHCNNIIKKNCKVKILSTQFVDVEQETAVLAHEIRKLFILSE